MVDKRFSLIGIIEGLMVSENLGDVHDEINHLCDLAGLKRPTGGFGEGWNWAIDGEHQWEEASN